MRSPVEGVASKAVAVAFLERFQRPWDVDSGRSAFSGHMDTPERTSRPSTPHGAGRSFRRDVQMTEAEVAGPIEVEDYELASARLKWVEATACLDLPEQREALKWHAAECDAALAALPGGDVPASP